MHIQRCLSWFRKQKQAEGPKMMRSVVQKPLALNMLQLADKKCVHAGGTEVFTVTQW